ncbi:hypothetical protein [Synechococcus sp. PCC 7335]|uniref:hypothetical protein n=1 Tax=Synechococcus sp. (strain ATCC 29403 / PCC 7335) TaxID=91464 RepID=UPI0002F51266|nr:hypothetical protein [Synechococcus sp. PCC 7335]
MRVLFIVPFWFVALFVMGMPAVFNSGPDPDPDDVLLFVEDDYQRKARYHAELDERQEALDTCTEIEEKFSNSFAYRMCLLKVYGVLDDIDGKIEIYEQMLAIELANGDSGVLTSRVLEGLRKEREEKK